MVSAADHAPPRSGPRTAAPVPSWSSRTTSTRVSIAAAGKTDLNGYGARLWINGAPFHFPTNSSIALFLTQTPDQKSVGQRTTFYGGQLDQFLVRRPFGGFIDPVISVSAGAIVARIRRRSPGALPGHTTSFALAPGGGIRIPIPTDPLRFDAKDLILDDCARGGTTDAAQPTRSGRIRIHVWISPLSLASPTTTRGGLQPAQPPLCAVRVPGDPRAERSSRCSPSVARHRGSSDLVNVCVCGCFTGSDRSRS